MEEDDDTMNINTNQSMYARGGSGGSGGSGGGGRTSSAFLGFQTLRSQTSAAHGLDTGLGRILSVTKTSH